MTVVTEYGFNSQLKFSSNNFISDCFKNHFQGPGLFPITITKVDNLKIFSFFPERVGGGGGEGVEGLFIKINIIQLRVQNNKCLTQSTAKKKTQNDELTLIIRRTWKIPF